jgi:hypothetical protein
MIESQNVSVPISHQKIQPFEFETRREAKLTKLQHYHTNFTNTFQIYIHHKTF